ncbi:unnamed protein product [Vicia faba]|uniref:DUF4178 domain-containing protein n=1 Tax=Vicia faba TaxID=3906 RepID=A0AAV1BD23_VICFA|nr:unnamed protein product [Vicia faba]
MPQFLLSQSRYTNLFTDIELQEIHIGNLMMKLPRGECKEIQASGFSSFFSHSGSELWEIEWLSDDGSIESWRFMDDEIEIAARRLRIGSELVSSLMELRRSIEEDYEVVM